MPSRTRLRGDEPPQTRKALPQRHRVHKAVEPHDPSRVSDRKTNIASSWRCEPKRWHDSVEFAKRFTKFPNRRASARADIADRAARPRFHHRASQHRDNVVDIDEIPLLRTIAMHRERLPS